MGINGKRGIGYDALEQGEIVVQEPGGGGVLEEVGAVFEADFEPVCAADEEEGHVDHGGSALDEERCECDDLTCRHPTTRSAGTRLFPEWRGASVPHPNLSLRSGSG